MKSIIYNATIYVMDNQRSLAEAIAIDGEIVVAIGTNEEILKLRTDDTEIIDAKGKFILPGFNDSHVHLLKAGISFQQIDLSNTKSIEDIVSIGKRYIQEKNLPNGSWIFGRGWNQFYLKEREIPNKYDLDQISSEHPIVFIRLCEHIISVNSKALELAKITNKTQQIDGGIFDIDENGEPTGVFRDVARDLIYQAVAEPSIEQIKESLAKAVNVAVSYGVTSLQTDDIWTLPSKNYRKIISAYQELEAENRLPIRIYEQCVLETVGALKEFLKDGFKTGQGSSNFKIGPFKAFVDGAMGSRTAYFTEPYDDDKNTCGFSIHSQEELDELMLIAHEAGMQLIAHAIGNKGIYMCLESYKKAQNRKHVEDFRPGIIHAQATDCKQNKILATENILVIGDPVVLKDDIHMVDIRLGKSRAQYTYNYRDMIDKNVKLSMSTDWPINAINPMNNIYVAVTRKDYDGFPKEGWHSEQRISVDEAVYAYTTRSAYCSYEEEVKGSLEVGKLADLVILSDDIFNLEPKELLKVKVEMTMIGGQIVFIQSKKF